MKTVSGRDAEPGGEEEALVLQHIPCEPPGIYEEVLLERGYRIHWVELDEGEPLPDWRRFGRIVAMGGPMGAYDDGKLPWLADEKRLISEAVRSGTPCWGVCLGAQLLAAALGAEVYAADETEIGLLPVRITDEAAEDPVFAGLPQEIPTLQWHGDVFELPGDAVRLASSGAYPNQAFRWGESYGVQFHLEADARMVGEWASVSSYGEALERTLGAEALPRLLADVERREDVLHAHGRRLFGRWLEATAHTPPEQPPEREGRTQRTKR